MSELRPSKPSDGRRVLVTGVTGYIGGLLAPELLRQGHSVRCLVRDPSRWSPPDQDKYEVLRGDVLDATSLPAVLAGIDAAYYLIHSMRAGEAGFTDRDRTAATNFARAAKAAGVKHVVYLGGLGDSRENLSPHLRSRHETGELLRKYGPPVTEFRAAMIVGAGSLSFEMLRYLVHRLPIMICPRWVTTPSQPIAAGDVLRYLIAALNEPRAMDRIFEIGGADVLTYYDMMLQYARIRGKRRFIIRVPVLTPRLSSYWVEWVTPVPSGYVRPLIEGLRNPVVVRDPSAREVFPITPMSFADAVREALKPASP